MTEGLGQCRSRMSRGRMSVIVAACVLGCLSPTMPLPPPAKPTIDGPDDSGRVTLSGSIPRASYVYADNQSTGYSAGTIVNPETGDYRFSIQASVGDSMSLYYRQDGELSQARAFEIPEPEAARGGAGGQGGATFTSGGSGQAGAAGSSSLGGLGGGTTAAAGATN